MVNATIAEPVQARISLQGQLGVDVASFLTEGRSGSVGPQLARHLGQTIAHYRAIHRSFTTSAEGRLIFAALPVIEQEFWLNLSEAGYDDLEAHGLPLPGPTHYMRIAGILI